ncbi:MAG: tetratricopeptide repeat protein [Candidatus Thermoplasmatota archaeon]|nr:tetratricopeptide repeat protein [Candidatus Thermoplasmatota archaeon]
MGFLGKRKAKQMFEEGLKLHKAGDLKGAEWFYTQALAYDPNHFEVHLNYGDLLRKTDRPRAAELEYKKASIMDPERGEPYAALGALHHAARNYEDAESFYRKALEIQPGDMNTHLNLAQLLMDTVRFTEAKKIYSNLQHRVTDPRLKRIIEDRLR